MDARRWTDVVAAFDELVELEPAAQKQRLAALGASDPDLRRFVEELLAGDAHADDRLAGIDHAFTTAFVPTSAREGDADPLKLVGRIVSHFRIIEPLAYGGMGVVYRAEDTQLKRVIALKFPLPAHRFDRSAKERFLHEARVAGALDHPNLCPVHEVGETEDGHLFYAMPLYQGETLRQRLAREGALPVADAINVAKQIATGLGAAHMAGIIHRDLKPANVMLLRDGTVRILDFGLAKESDLGSTDPWRTLGTVSYMAPEQFQGREVDSRADLWALGVVFYEMLTGMRPFRGNHAIGIAHTIVHAEPEPPSLLRGEVTGRVDDVVQTLLRKDPAQRYSSAEEVATALSANVSESLAHDRDGGGAMDTSTLATFSSRPGRSVSRQRMAWSAIGVFTLLVGGSMTFRALGIWPGGSLLSRGSLNPSDSLVVADFDIRGADSSLGRTIASVVGTALSQSTVVTIVPDGIIRSALQRMQRPTAALFVSPVARELAQREGFKAVVEGELAQLATGFVVTVRLVSADGEQLVSVHETAAHLDALLPTIERLTGRIRGRIGESLKRVRASPALDQVTTGSLEALRKYAEVRLLTFDDHARGLLLLKEAVALDSSFAMAWILMSAVYRNGDYPPELAIDALERAYRFRDRLPYRERYHAIGGYFRVGKGRDRARAAEAYEAGLKMDSGGFANNLGLLYMSRREYARAESLFRWYFNRQSGLQVAYENLSNTLYFQGKREEAELVEAETARRFSGAERWGRTAWYLYNRGQLDSAQRAIERQREEGDATLRRVAWLQLSALHLVRGRIAEAERARAEATVANLARGVSRDSVGEELWLASIDSWHRNQPRRALLRLERALARTPLTSLPLVSPQAGEPYYTWVARIYAHARQPDRARAMLVKFTADVRDTALKRVNEWAIHAARGEIALAEGRPLVALVEFRLADQLSDGPIHLSALGFHADVGRAYDEAGMADSAIASFERYLDTPQLIRSAHDATYLAHVLQRLGALYDAKGDRAKAIDYYDRVTELWRNADPELQPKVAQVRRRTELLRSSEQH